MRDSMAARLIGIRTDGSMAAVLYLILAILLSRQITRSRTPAGISRVSRWTFLSQSIVDSISFASVSVDGRSIP